MIIRNGRVLLDRTFVHRDLEVADGRIQAILPEGTRRSDPEIVDATGLLVTPGLMDFHVHAFQHGHHIGLDVTEVAPRSGVTTFVDAGSVGALSFPAFRKFVMDRTDLNLFAYLNISLIGQTTSGIVGLAFHDNDVRELIHLPLAEEMITKHRDVIKGIKVRVYTGMPDLYALEQALVLAARVDLPIMVHLGPSPPPVAETLKLLRSGDILTHPYHGGSDTILDSAGQIRPEFLDARQRGVEVDLGMDRFHCDLAVMRRAFEQGFFPDYVSTDLTLTNVNSVTFDLPTTISKCVACGMPLEDALWRASAAVGKKLAVPELSGRIAVGERADLALFRWEVMDNPLVDFFGHSIAGARQLKNVATYLGGQLLSRRQTDTALWDCTERSVPWANYSST